MRHLFPLLLLFLLHATVGYTQAAIQPEKWTMQHTITSSLGGSSSNIRDFKNMFLIGLIYIGIGIAFLIAGKFDDSTKKEPFSAQWILKSNTATPKQNNPEHLKKNSPPGNQLP